jgi:hypothetical protein
VAPKLTRASRGSIVRSTGMESASRRRCGARSIQPLGRALEKPRPPPADDGMAGVHRGCADASHADERKAGRNCRRSPALTAARQHTRTTAAQVTVARSALRRLRRVAGAISEAPPTRPRPCQGPNRAYRPSMGTAGTCRVPSAAAGFAGPAVASPLSIRPGPETCDTRSRRQQAS